jgi:hypothetical protein
MCGRRRVPEGMLRAAAIALLFLPAMTVVRHATPFSVGATPVTITLDAAKAKSRLLRAPKGDVVLEVSGVTAAKPPGFIAAVFVGDERVGEVSLYAYDTPQSFAFPAGAAVAKALRAGTSVPVCFRAESGIEGQPAHVDAPIHIGAVALLIERN